MAAILAADVVGYSRLMAADESGTHARLKALRKQFIEPTIAAHHGRTVKLMGDGALVEFASVVDAVQCAVEIQRAMAERETDLADDQRIRFRVGVNLGDVIIEDDDIYGDGVNIAARLEGLAEPGGIVISGTAFDHARKAQAGFRFLGRQLVKNIPEPVRAYQVLLDPAAVGTGIEDQAPAAPSRWRWPATAAASVAVIAVMSGISAWLWLSDRPASVVGRSGQ
jgi:adenylate cyclase